MSSDSDEISYARKAIMLCGLSLDISGRWSVQQLIINANSHSVINTICGSDDQNG